LDTALADGADMIATGHYARILQGPASQKPGNTKYQTPKTKLLMAEDQNKDQTYFLYRISQAALEKTLFPLGGYTKPQVRELAKKFKLVTADKKESMGICFVGKVGIKEFLKQYVDEQAGAIIDQAGNRIGMHDGAIFYTIGQRHGLDVGGGLPYYVTGKDMAKNEVYVTTDLQDEKLWSRQLKLVSAHWIEDAPKGGQKLSVRTRHRAKLIPVKLLNKSSNSVWTAELEEDVRAITPGQSAVFYRGSECLGGGLVTA
jgi:tRNA-uridine 2-sulfurtransferase